MSKVYISNANNEKIEIDVIRYFENNDSKYLIYSLNEPIGDGYIKLYASKILDDNGYIITNEEEWDLVKKIIKEVIKSNHEGTELNIFDLNETELEDVVLQDTRVFKLQGNLVNLLSDNKKVVKHAEKEEVTVIEDIDVEQNYQELYEEQIKLNKDLTGQLNNYKYKLDKIISLIEE